MEYCYKCEISDAQALLFDVILPEKIDKICNRCSHEDGLPLITKTNVTEENEPRLSVHERLSRLANVPIKKPDENNDLKREETKLKEIVNRNFRMTV